MTLRNALCIVCCALLLVAPLADAKQERRQKGHDKPQAELLDTRAALSRARGQLNGRVLSTKLIERGQPVYKVRLLSPSGRVHHIYIDARTGAVVGQDQKD